MERGCKKTDHHESTHPATVNSQQQLLQGVLEQGTSGSALGINDHSRKVTADDSLENNGRYSK
ncbi:unnamed protein product [Clonostachys rosea f. rosea IK726]|uniref:Uncharacterized protein n=1 Tax=Clonostachys rosea f. rosea IK726 TaxID=1349383 RepID=A0ACA9THW2_BIOOC|nr:unnamed protein product [Clonostachys rosea f. rosea IK726]